jgi:WD40 repeat protein
VQLAPESCHTECIQIVVSSADGKFLLTGGDDKHAKLWGDWTCVKTVTVPRRWVLPTLVVDSV